MKKARRFFYHYVWFWKESFSFCEGDSKLFIIKGCLRMAHKHAAEMMRWESMTPEQREHWYLTADRTIEF